VSLRITAVLALAGLLCACSGGGESNGILHTTVTPVPQATPKAYVPDEEPTPVNPAGRVTTQINATCRLSVVDAVISASYRASVVGPNTSLRRVRLLLNNKLADDSGDIFTATFEKDVTLHVAAGTNYSLIVTYIATNAIGPQILNVVRCPMSPGPGA
jgi:hypothetical protein